MNTKILPILLMSSFSSFAFADSWLPDFPGNYSPTDGYWGDWGSSERCPQGQYVDSYMLKSEGAQGNGDDSALNGIALHCSGGSNVSSTVSKWGSWGYPAYCSGPVTGFAIQIEVPQGDGDDTAANDVALMCRNGNVARAEAKTHWGNWSNFQFCPSGQVVVGLMTRVERPQGDGDDSGLNGVRMICGNP